MTSRRERLRSQFALETLEGRVALSGIGGLDDGGGAAAVRPLRRGADDPASHNANDDKGGTAVGVHQHRGGRTAAVQGHRRGGEHPVGHK